MATLSFEKGLSGLVMWEISGLGAAFNTSTYIRAGVSTSPVSSGASSITGIVSYVNATSAGTRTSVATNMSIRDYSPGRYTMYGWAQTQNGKYYPAGSATLNIYGVTVNFYANGGSGAPSAQSKVEAISSSISIAIPSTQPTRSGYEFNGWGTSSTSTSASYYSGQSYTFTGTTSGANVNLYAVWKSPLTLTIVENTSSSINYEYNWTISGLSLPFNTSNYQRVGVSRNPVTPGSTSLDMGQYSSSTTARSSSTKTTVTGQGYAPAGTYTFYGFALTANGQYWPAGGPVTITLPTPSSKDSIESVTPSPSQTSVDFSVKIKVGGISGSGTYYSNVPWYIDIYLNGTRVSRNTYSYSGYVGSTYTYSKTISGLSSSTTYTYRVYTDGGQTAYASDVYSGVFTTTTPPTPTTYYADVYFDPNGGSGGPTSASGSGTSSSVSITIPSSRPTWSGHTFQYWYRGSNVYYPGNSYTFTGSESGTSYTLTAAWSSTTYYAALSFNANGGTGAPGTVNGSASGTDEVELTIPTKKPTRDCYEFRCWTYGGVEYYPGETVYFTGTTSGRTYTMTAQWDPLTYYVEIDFDPNGGEDEPDSIFEDADGTRNIRITLPSAVPKRPAYKFQYWLCNGTQYQPGTAYTFTGSEDTRTYTLVAQWKLTAQDWIGNGNKWRRGTFWIGLNGKWHRIVRWIGNNGKWEK